jgi:hypothetical protein
MPKRSNGKRGEPSTGRRPLWRGLSLRSSVRTAAPRVIVPLALALALALAAVAGLWWNSRQHVSHAKTAAIVDQLSLTAPDPDFVASVTQTLTQARYAVDYYSGDQVTVEFYRHLPDHHYDLVILRAHSGLTTVTNADTGAVTHTKSVSLFTSQPFDPTQYQAERNAGRLGHSRYLEDGQEVRGVFGIEPDFVRSSMEGRFDHTLVVLMGCNGLDAPSMARAFLDKGASAVVGWDNFVSADFTDKVTSRFLATLLTRNVSVHDAVQQTATEFGRDPQYGGLLQLVADENG